MITSQAALEAAAVYISKLPTAKWAGWIVYLLETLEERTETQLAERVLRDVQRAISERLAAGRW